MIKLTVYDKAQTNIKPRSGCGKTPRTTTKFILKEI